MTEEHVIRQDTGPVTGAGLDGGDQFLCKICSHGQGRFFKSASQFMNHLASNHASAEGGSYSCRYGDNGICSACPAVGISQADYTAHVYTHHVTRDRLQFSKTNDTWSVLSSTVNLPAVLNDPGKGKQRDFFTRSWGVDFADSALLPSSPHLCELPNNAFDRYLRKVRKHYTSQSPASTPPSSSREATPSPSPPPRPGLHQHLHKLDIPHIFLDQNFDLSNPNTFNIVFPFLNESLQQSTRTNPFTIESHEARQVETSGKLVQEKLQHYIDQVEVSIAGQVASKSHHFFQVMTYHDALMSQLLALISVVRTLRQRLSDVEGGVIQALRVPQLAMRRKNLVNILHSLGTIETLHNTQPTIQVLLTRQEFSGALDLISTSEDILGNEVVEVEALRHLPSQLGDLRAVIGKMLLTDFHSLVQGEMDSHLVQVRATCHQETGDTGDTGLAEGSLGPIVTALVRQRSYSFLEFLEEQAVVAVKAAIKEVTLTLLDTQGETTLTQLVADFALIASPDGWIHLLDMLVGSLLVVLRRVNSIYLVVDASLEQGEHERLEDRGSGPSQLERLRSSAREVMVNICDQVHERLGKLVTVRSRPVAIKLVTPEELSQVGSLVTLLVTQTENMCGKTSAGLQLSYQGQVILYLQTFHEEQRSLVLTRLEVERWRKGGVDRSEFMKLHPVLGSSLAVDSLHIVKDGEMVEEVQVKGEPHTFADAVVTLLSTLSHYLQLGDSLPNARVEVGLKIAELLKLFNSRTCQLVLGAGAVNLAGLKTITIRNLAVTLRSLSLVSGIIPEIRRHISSPGLTGKQEVTLGRNLDSASKDYSDHLGELERKIVQIVDAALSQQLASWERIPPVPSSSFKAIGKQLTKLLEAVQDVLPAVRVAKLFSCIHSQFLGRVRERLKQAGLLPDNSPTHGLVLSELIFYRENLRYLGVLGTEELSDRALQVVWKR